MFDYHVHSTISFDAVSTAEEMISAAAAKGLKEICFTEHMDIDPAGVSVKFRLDFPRYDAQFERLLAQNYPVAIKQGMEIGVFAGAAEEFEKITAGHDYDFVLCSQHFVGTKDPYYPSFYEGKTMHEAYRDYLAEILKSLQAYKNYDVVGHIGYPSKYYRGEEPCKFNYGDFPDLIDEILKTAVRDGKGIEANTSSIPKTGDTIATSEMLRRFRELGGEIVTVGSDAHRAENVGSHIPETLEKLKSLGFRYVCTFAKRKPVFHKLADL